MWNHSLTVISCLRALLQPPPHTAQPVERLGGTNLFRLHLHSLTSVLAQLRLPNWQQTLINVSIAHPAPEPAGFKCGQIIWFWTQLSKEWPLRRPVVSPSTIWQSWDEQLCSFWRPKLPSARAHECQSCSIFVWRYTRALLSPATSSQKECGCWPLSDLFFLIFLLLWADGSGLGPLLSRGPISF